MLVLVFYSIAEAGIVAKNKQNNDQAKAKQKQVRVKNNLVNKNNNQVLIRMIIKMVYFK